MSVAERHEDVYTPELTDHLLSEILPQTCFVVFGNGVEDDVTDGEGDPEPRPLEAVPDSAFHRTSGTPPSSAAHKPAIALS